MASLTKILFKNILLMALIFILVSSTVHAINYLNWDNSKENKYTFIDTAKWDDQHNWKTDWGKNTIHSLFAFKPVGSNSYINMDFTKDFWQPIEPWEYQVCSQGLSTELNQKENQVDIGGSIYNTTITVTANQFVPAGNNSYLYEISWYIHPFGETGDYYTINLVGPGVDDVFKPKTGAGQRRGDMGYETFYATKNYTQVKLVYLADNIPHFFQIASGPDKNRPLI